MPIAIVFVGALVIEALSGRLLQREKSRRRDVLIEVISGAVIVLFTVPTILFVGKWLIETAAPGSANALAHWPWWAMAAVLLVGDDMTHYWWHRTAHTVPWLYNLHRAHHSAEYMSARIVYRNNVFFYLMMPALWISAMLVHLGFGSVYVVYMIVKMTVIIGAHSNVRWDAFLYRTKWLAPIAWVIERTISTPSTHSAHHGKHADDGVTHYKGNFGNMLFFWDVIFGTAKVTRQYPEAFGLEDLPEETWATELLWPVVPKAAEPDRDETVLNAAE